MTVVETSPLITSILNGERKMKKRGGYFTDRQRRDWAQYFLTDRIYPSWAIYVKPNYALQNSKESAMTATQENRRNDVERLFDVFQESFRILRHEFHERYHSNTSEILEACLIIHNISLEMRLSGELHDEKDADGNLLTSRQVIEEFELVEAHSQHQTPDLESLP